MQGLNKGRKLLLRAGASERRALVTPPSAAGPISSGRRCGPGSWRDGSRRSWTCRKPEWSGNRRGAWENKLDALRPYRRATGHLAPRQDAVWDDPPGGDPLPIGQHLANLRRKGGLGKDPGRRHAAWRSWPRSTRTGPALAAELAAALPDPGGPVRRRREPPLQRSRRHVRRGTTSAPAVASAKSRGLSGRWDGSRRHGSIPSAGCCSLP